MMNWSKYIDRLKRKKQAERIKQMVKDAMATWPKGGPVKGFAGDIADHTPEVIKPVKSVRHRQYPDADVNTGIQSLVLDSKGPVVVFTDNADRQRELHSHLEKQGLKVQTVHGATSLRSRSVIFEHFQRGCVPILLLSIRVCATGVRLDAADTLVLLDIVRGTNLAEQAEGRAWRITRARPLKVYYLKTTAPQLHPYQQKAMERMKQAKRQAEWLSVTASPDGKKMKAKTVDGKTYVTENSGGSWKLETDLEEAIRRLRDYKHIMAMGDVGRMVWDGLPEFMENRFSGEKLPDYLIRKAREAMGDKLASLKCGYCGWHGFQTKHLHHGQMEPYVDPKPCDYVTCPNCGISNVI